MRLLCACERVLDELLGDRRAALGRRRRCTTSWTNARAMPRRSTPRVLVEALVLDRDDRVLASYGAIWSPATRTGSGWWSAIAEAACRGRRAGPSCLRLGTLRRFSSVGQVGRDRHHHPEDGRDDGEQRERRRGSRAGRSFLTLRLDARGRRRRRRGSAHSGAMMRCGASVAHAAAALGGGVGARQRGVAGVAARAPRTAPDSSIGPAMAPAAPRPPPALAAQRRRLAARGRAGAQARGRRARGAASCGSSSGSTRPRPTSTSATRSCSQKLREFQDLGHRVVLIVGDYTARVGDPSGRSTTRPGAHAARRSTPTPRPTSEQAFTVLRDDPERLEVRRNGEWLDMRDGGALPPRAHDDRRADARARRLRQALRRAAADLDARAALPAAAGLRLGRRSHADVELGGTDQTFNLLLGRDVQRAYGQPEQVDPDDADPARDRRRREDVEVAGQPHRRHRGARRDVRQDAAAARRGAWSTWFDAAGGRRGRRRAPGRATPSTRSRARSWRASTARRPRRRPRRTSIACSSATRRPTRSPSSPSARRDGDGPPAGADRRRVRALALGGAAPAGPGRRQARRRGAGGGRLDVPPDRLDGPVLQVGKRHFRACGWPPGCATACGATGPRVASAAGAFAAPSR